MTVERMCRRAGVSRAGFYRFRAGEPRSDADVELRDAIQRIAVEFPSYGRPRITAERKRRDWEVNHQRVHRILREDNLLCLRRRKFLVTTDSCHNLAIYPNLAREMVLSGRDQLGVADITSIRLEWELVYLAVILDAFSRREIGWALDRSREDTLTLSALRMALGRRQPGPGLVHHSDRGVPYASKDSTDLWKEHGIVSSRSRTANPFDNATCESFLKTLPYEEVYRQEYRDLAAARASIQRFIEKVYNEKRLRLAGGYRPPVAFEHRLPTPAAVSMAWA